VQHALKTFAPGSIEVAIAAELLDVSKDDIMLLQDNVNRHGERRYPLSRCSSDSARVDYCHQTMLTSVVLLVFE
jgi:hypothetical protein